MKQVTRRSFLKGSVGTIAGLTAMNIVRPSMVYADGLGNGNNIILFNLAGGYDGLSHVPLSQGPAYDALLPLRPNTRVLTSDVIYEQAGGGFLNARGLNKAFIDLVNQSQYNSSHRIRIIEGVGKASVNTSHEEATNVYSAGAERLPSGNRKGWIARLMDLHGFNQYQVFGIGNFGDKIDFNTDAANPIVLSSISNYAYQNADFPAGGIPCGSGCSSDVTEDSQYAQKIMRDLLQQGQTRRVHQLAKEALQGMHDSIPLMTGPGGINSMTTSGSFVDSHGVTRPSYPNTGLGNNCRDAVKVLKYAEAFGQLQNKSRIIFLERGGFDSHSDQVTGQQGNAENGSLWDISYSLSSMITDLKAAGIYHKTTIITFGEFGRTVRENGSRGTDHGHGSASLVIGGSVQPGRVGVEPTVANITSGPNYLAVGVDFRDPLKQILAWAGIDASDVFTESSPINFGNLGIFG